MYALARSLLFRLSPERAHQLTISMLKTSNRLGLLRWFCPSVEDNPVQVMGLTFRNPIGLAAGFDKNGEALDALNSMGFGFVEIGTVTPKAQLGNDKPRLFRLVSERAVINRMGFNNHGVDYLLEQVKKSNFHGVLGINIGKNKMTPEEKAIDDYLYCFRKVYKHADYVAINLSSPNTPGLRNLQFGKALDSILSALKKEQKTLSQQFDHYTPIAIKIAPDMSREELQQIARQLLEHQIDGVIATNTTIDKSNLSSKEASEAGGVSGIPLKAKSTAAIKVLADELKGEIPIIGVGGVHSCGDAAEKIAAGASLVQIYTGLVYKGPDLIEEAARGAKRAKKQLI